MNKLNIFLCDLRGTYTDHYKLNSVQRKQNVNNFITSLEHIVETDKLNSLLFCFITTDDMKTLYPYIKEIENQLKNNELIIPYIHYSDNNKYYNTKISETKDNNKISQSLSILENLDINNLYIADDSSMNHKLLNHIIKGTYPNINIINFKSNSSINSGIEYFTQEINNYCYEKRKDNNKITKKHIY